DRPCESSAQTDRQPPMQATELLLHTFPSADTAFRFAVAGAFDVVAEEEGVLVSELRGDREVQGRLQRIIRERYPRSYVRSRDPSAACWRISIAPARSPCCLRARASVSAASANAF